MGRPIDIWGDLQMERCAKLLQSEWLINLQTDVWVTYRRKGGKSTNGMVIKP
ncbi:hypothetical protein DPMN_090390 [Dreissena polymorpha]|uniref:Uncharacterized protein n=1 Tax=Dreissena polymorpha TaxID=45954 RepID=A0A9D4KZN0_DREPO|nr:hypothetical protein DPMN_090390 [Dreissena polymorpha]